MYLLYYIVILFIYLKKCIHIIFILILTKLKKIFIKSQQLFNPRFFMKVNGKFVQLAKPLSLQEYLEREKYVTAHVAVERNGHIVPRADFSRTMLGDEDCLEIVAFVGGG